MAGDRSGPFFYSNFMVFAGVIDAMMYDGPIKAAVDTIRMPMFRTRSHILISTGT